MTFNRNDWNKAHKKSEFYGSIRWRKLARLIGARDQFICQKCGKFCPGRREGVADHKIPRQKRPDLAYEHSNLWWLCTHCHNTWKRLEELHADAPRLGDDGMNPEWEKG